MPDPVRTDGLMDCPRCCGDGVVEVRTLHDEDHQLERIAGAIEHLGGRQSLPVEAMRSVARIAMAVEQAPTASGVLALIDAARGIRAMLLLLALALWVVATIAVGVLALAVLAA